MYYAIAKGKVDTAGYAVEQVLEDIESLNRRALAGELEVTAHLDPRLRPPRRPLRAMACGASMGDGYGPIVVATEPFSPASSPGRRSPSPER